LRTSVFMIGLLFGRSTPWSGQERGVAALSWRIAARGLWWVSLFGCVVAGVLGTVRPAVLWWAMPLLAGYLAAIPFAVATAAPRLGALFVRCGLNGVPEDFDPPLEIKRLGGGR
jgi:membrane glycosyltransferase